jgi:hypothetical protein
MTNVAEQNIAMLRQRWPTIANAVLSAETPQDIQWDGFEDKPTLSVQGLRLWSAYDTHAEARLQASGIPDHAAEATVYGIGGGDLLRVLLERPTLRRLNVIPLNQGLFHLLLHILDHRDWLGNAKVQLGDAAQETKVRFPFAVIPPCLSLCDSRYHRLRDRLAQALETPFQNEVFDRREPKRRQQVEQNAELVASDGDVASLFGSAPGSTVFLASAGPTLAQTMSWIQNHRSEGILLAVDGALRPLLDNQLVPEIVVTVDDNYKTVLPYFETDLSRCAQTPLVYAPVVHHDILRRWPGPRLATYTDEAIYDALRQSHPRATLFSAGSVTHRAVDLAVKLGAERVIFFGADFGFPKGQIHANDKGPIDYYSNAAKGGTTTIDGHGRTISTMNNFNGYRVRLEEYISQHQKVTFYNSSQEGAMIIGTQYIDTRLES